jgi:predicted glycogen debranching enzyme
MDAPVWYLNTIYRREQERGYAGLEDLWMPGVIGCTLTPGKTFHLVCSLDKIDLGRIISLVSQPPRPLALPLDSSDPDLIDLARAGSPYVLNFSSDSSPKPQTAVITHYPWSSPSVRGEMISLAGLFLVPGRLEEARSLLESRAALANAGVLPSLLPEDSSPPVYHGADVSLWFINAVHQYLQYSADEAAGRRLLDVVNDIIDNYRHGTRLGIIADSDGLISTGVPGIPTTWMDAQLESNVITPRAGRPVEINALWYNALRVAADLHQRWGSPSRGRELSEYAETVQSAFNQRFWNEESNCLFDVVGDQSSDPSVRPNQIFAVSLPYPALWLPRRAAVIDTVVNELLTPMGVRTLSPRDSAYQGRYQGNVVLRDRAYHQGSAYPWLLGPLVTAILKTRGRTPAALSLAREILRPTIQFIRGAGLGQICELFDGDAPHRPGGALASAPAAAELLRAWAEDVLAISPPSRPAAEDHPPVVVAARQ